MNAKLLSTHALTPLHPGTGQGVGVIDLPIAREVSTGLPYLPGSSLKGVLRDEARSLVFSENKQENTKMRHAIFGPDTQNASDHAGSVQFTDQRLLLFPVRSLRGTFAWVTSPLVLRRFARDVASTNLTGLPTVPTIDDVGDCIVVSNKSLVYNGNVYLEDLDLAAHTDAENGWGEWLAGNLFDEAWRSPFQERFCIVHDDILSFLLQTATEVVARIRLEEDSKTVAKGGLWYEEALPAETILAGLVIATPIEASKEQVFSAIKTLTAQPVQVGGNATVGRGICQLRVEEGGD